jgi:hypothetical protein
MNIEPVPQIVIDNFLSGVPCSIGPFRCDQSHLYWQNKMIAFRKNGECFRVDNLPIHNKPPKQSIPKKIHRFLVGFSWPFIAFWIAATTTYLIIINIF